MKRSELNKARLLQEESQREQQKQRVTVVNQLLKIVGPVPESLHVWMLDLDVKIDTTRDGWQYVDCNQSLRIQTLGGCQFWDDNTESGGAVRSFLFDLPGLEDADQWREHLRYASANWKPTCIHNYVWTQKQNQLRKLCQQPTRSVEEWAQLLQLTNQNKALSILFCYFGVLGRRDRESLLNDYDDDLY